MVGIIFFFTACSKSCASSTPSMSLRLSTWRASTSSFSLNSPSDRFCGGSWVGAAPPIPGASRRLEFLRPDAGQRRQALAQRIHARELRLHLAELDRHRVQVLLQEHALALGFGLLGGGDELLQGRQANLGGVAQREPVKRSGRTEQQQQREERRADQVRDRHVD